MVFYLPLIVTYGIARNKLGESNSLNIQVRWNLLQKQHKAVLPKNALNSITYHWKKQREVMDVGNNFLNNWLQLKQKKKQGGYCNTSWKLRLPTPKMILLWLFIENLAGSHFKHHQRNVFPQCKISSSSAVPTGAALKTIMVHRTMNRGFICTSIFRVR